MSDIVSFHEYGNTDDLRKSIQKYKEYGKPVVCTEWLNRKSSSFKTHLPIFIEENIGCYQWGLFAGKTQTFLSWDTNENTPGIMPDVWQHDLLHKDGTAYDPSEIEFIAGILKDLDS